MRSLHAGHCTSSCCEGRTVKDPRKTQGRVRVYPKTASTRNDRDEGFAIPSPESESLIPVLRACVRRKDALPQPDRRRRHFDQLIVVDELDRLLEAELARRDQTDRFVG